jgi:putative PIN family toxin of toxin-antitoxin system
LDCNTLVQAIAFDNSPASLCLRLAEQGIVELFISKATLAELRRVLAYEEILAISPNMTPERIDAFLQRLTYRAALVRNVRHTMDYPRDPDDEAYLDLAIAAKTDYLVSRDRDLLVLMTGHSLICKRFRRQAHPLRILEPEQFLAEVGFPWKSGRSK